MSCQGGACLSCGLANGSVRARCCSCTPTTYLRALMPYGPRVAGQRSGLGWHGGGLRQEEAKAEVTGVAEADRAGHWRRKDDAERSGGAISEQETSHGRRRPARRLRADRCGGLGEGIGLTRITHGRSSAGGSAPLNRVR